MNNKTFGVVVGVIIALALAMFAGLYMLGLSSDGGGAFNDGYDYTYDDTLLDDNTVYDDTYYNEEDLLYTDYTEDGSEDFYFDENGNAYTLDENGDPLLFDDFTFEDFGDDSTIINVEAQ